jgi:hypothetical protein
MSIEAMAWALNTSLSKAQAKLVLVGLGNHARAEFDEARPSVSTLARYASCSTRSVQRELRSLEADGWIEKTGVWLVEGRSDKAINVYRLIRERGDRLSPRESSGVTERAERGDTALSPEPSIETVHRERAPARADGRLDDENPALAVQVQREADRRRVWSHYQATIPNGKRYALTDARRRMIAAALKVRSVEECCAAITGLSRSDYHVDGGYLDIKYALRGGGATPSVESTIDRLREPRPARRGNGPGGRESASDLLRALDGGA